MKPLIQFKQTSIILTTLALLCSGTLPVARAVLPLPDGCYLGLTTAEGCNALFSLSTGQGNTAIGQDALFSDTTGSWNTGVGAVALGFNNADFNTALGVAGLLLNNTGAYNTAVGAAALLNDTAGGGNTAIGAQALLNNTSGDNFSGANTAVGAYALWSNTTSGANTGIGYGALGSVTDLGANTALGDLAGYNITGGGNIALGFHAGYNLTSGDNNICIGSDLRGEAGESNTIRIGSNLPDEAGASACYMGGVNNQSIDPGTATAVQIDVGGKLGTTTSSRRFKRDIEPMDKASEAILALKPVTFHYKSDAKNRPCFGLIAEEVAEVNPDLVVRNKKGEVWTVRYEQINAMLLNEFLKQHRKVDEQDRKIQQQETTIAELKQEMRSMVARFNEQDAKIQKVSDDVKLDSGAPRFVVEP